MTLQGIMRLIEAAYLAGKEATLNDLTEYLKVLDESNWIDGWNDEDIEPRRDTHSALALTE